MNVLSLIEAEARDELEKSTSLDEKIRIAFRFAKNHWMVVDENEQLQGALAAILHHTAGEEKERVELEIRQLKTLQAITQGVPVNLDGIEENDNPIGLMGIWNSV